MAEVRQNSCCRRAVASAKLQDYTPTTEDLAWLFGKSVRWISELRKRGVLPPNAALPELVKRYARYQPERALSPWEVNVAKFRGWQRIERD